jgi:hypothetical protein
MSADDNGYIFTDYLGTKEPAIIDTRRMVLPEPERLRSINKDDTIVFHPLSEAIVRGESVIVKKLKRQINIKLNYVVGTLAVSLLRLIASPDLHNRLTPAQSRLMTEVKEGDNKTHENFLSLMVKTVSNDPERAFVNIYLRRGGMHKGKKYARLGVVTFPFYEALIDENNKSFDKLRIKDRQAIKEVFEYIFQGIQIPDSYNDGSDSNIAPYLIALLNTSIGMTGSLNELVDIYEEHIDNAETCRFDDRWYEAMQDEALLLRESRSVPPMEGNEGSIALDEVQRQSTPSLASAVTNAMNAQPAPSPLQSQQPQLMAPVQPQVMVPQVQQPMMQGYPQVGMSQQVPMQAAVKKTEKGIDFQSLLNVNPSLAYAPNPIANTMAQQAFGQQVVMQAQRIPSWAMPQQQQYPQGMPMQQVPMQQPMQQAPIPPGYMWMQLQDGTMGLVNPQNGHRIA